MIVERIGKNQMVLLLDTVTALGLSIQTILLITFTHVHVVVENPKVFHIISAVNMDLMMLNTG